MAGAFAMAVCADCGASLGFGRRLTGAKRCADCERKARTAKDAAIAEYPLAVSRLIEAGPSTSSEERLRDLEQTISSGGGSFEELKLSTFRTFTERALADEILTAEEEGRLLSAAEALFGSQDLLATALAPYRAELFIAMV